MKRTLLLSVSTIIALHASETIPEYTQGIVVEYKRSTKDADIAVKQVSSSDSASLLSDAPGVSIATGGGMSNIPLIHGLADDRIKILVDGMPLTSTCPNHMNTPLSYIDPKRVAQVSVMAGVVPVSMGGDSIAGSIKVDSAKPIFAKAGEKIHTEGEIQGFYRSNNDNLGAFLNATIATSDISINYSGSSEKAGNYKDGNLKEVKATLYKQHNQFVTVAKKTENGIFKAQIGQQYVPYQGFANEYMDLLNDKATFGNLSYVGFIGDYTLDAKAFWKKAHHYMNKIPSERIGNMPMYTDGTEAGYAIKLDIPLTNEHTLKVGNDYHKYTLDDWWPATSTTVGGMGPNTFWNIHDGKREVFGTFAEINSEWSAKLKSHFGIRLDVVSMNTGNVQGYNNNTGAASTYNDKIDADAFNALDHAQKDYNLDISTSIAYQNSSTHDVEFGASRKTRSPNIHERYTWAGGYGSTINGPIAMDMAMVNWFGDGNGYVGNINLKPETAYSISATSSWHDEKNQIWGIKVTPYYTYVNDYIDVDWIQKANAGGYTNINLYRFANHDAILFGSDLSAFARVWNNESFGKGTIKTVVNYTRGYRTDGGNLYHMMPLNAKVSLEHNVGAWNNGIDIQAVKAKNSVDSLRHEPQTAGYTLVDVRMQYKIQKNITLDCAITNLFNKFYELPLGGVDALATKGSYNAMNGQGRSFNTSLSIKF